MSGAREAILSQVRHALGRTAAQESTNREVERRLAQPTRHVAPHLEDDLVGQFCAKVAAVAGSVARVPSLAQVPAAAGDFLDQLGEAHRAVLAPHPLLERIDWGPGWETARRSVADPGDRIAVTAAYGGVAETGSVVLLSGPESPTTLNFLPEIYLTVLPRRRIVGHLEDLWAMLRAERGVLPRTVNLITGPSRTADVEQTIQLGAHGPRRLHVLLVDD